MIFLYIVQSFVKSLILGSKVPPNIIFVGEE